MSKNALAAQVAAILAQMNASAAPAATAASVATTRQKRKSKPAASTTTPAKPADPTGRAATWTLEKTGVSEKGYPYTVYATPFHGRTDKPWVFRVTVPSDLVERIKSGL